MADKVPDILVDKVRVLFEINIELEPFVTFGTLEAADFFMNLLNVACQTWFLSKSCLAKLAFVGFKFEVNTRYVKI